MSHRCETHIITIGTEQSKASICLTGASATTHSNMVIKVYIATSSGSTSVRTTFTLFIRFAGVGGSGDDGLLHVGGSGIEKVGCHSCSS